MVDSKCVVTTFSSTVDEIWVVRMGDSDLTVRINAVLSVWVVESEVVVGVVVEFRELVAVLVTVDVVGAIVVVVFLAVVAVVEVEVSGVDVKVELMFVVDGVAVFVWLVTVIMVDVGWIVGVVIDKFTVEEEVVIVDFAGVDVRCKVVAANVVVCIVTVEGVVVTGGVVVVVFVVIGVVVTIGVVLALIVEVVISGVVVTCVISMVSHI